VFDCFVEVFGGLWLILVFVGIFLLMSYWFVLWLYNEVLGIIVL